MVVLAEGGHYGSRTADKSNHRPIREVANGRALTQFGAPQVRRRICPFLVGFQDENAIQTTSRRLNKQTKRTETTTKRNAATFWATGAATFGGQVKVMRLLVEVGNACNEYQNEVLRDLSSRRIQCDELWAFCYVKERNVPEAKQARLVTATPGHG